jgi:hypothetical protein
MNWEEIIHSIGDVFMGPVVIETSPKGPVVKRIVTTHRDGTVIGVESTWKRGVQKVSGILNRGHHNDD